MEKYNRHHIVPKSRWGSNVPENLVWLPEKVHVDFHRILSNKTPEEQLEHIRNKNATALTWIFKKRIAEVIYSHPEYIYKQWILVPNKLF